MAPPAAATAAPMTSPVTKDLFMRVLLFALPARGNARGLAGFGRQNGLAASPGRGYCIPIQPYEHPTPHSFLLLPDLRVEGIRARRRAPPGWQAVRHGLLCVHGLHDDVWRSREIHAAATAAEDDARRSANLVP